jgi:hypothetical protein
MHELPAVSVHIDNDFETTAAGAQGRLLLLGKGAVLTHRFARPLAAEPGEQRRSLSLARQALCPPQGRTSEPFRFELETHDAQTGS